MTTVSRILQKAQAFELATRPVSPKEEQALAKRWNDLPASAKSPGQLLGKRSTGCEATHGVFPKCNFSCKPCYHSADANKVRVDGPHTIAEVTRQMGYMNSQRGFGQFAQLIGGEVSLLDPEDHAACLSIMRRLGRMPMSFTHGDFDYDYLRSVAVDRRGRRRFSHLSFAAHFDSTMVGRSGAKKPKSEAELVDMRGEFCAMFDRLRSEFGTTSYLAHNMTVTPENLDQVTSVVEQSRAQGWRLFSFQPAAYIGDPTRWKGRFRDLTSDTVWSEVESGAGSVLPNGRLPYEGLRFGDLRCNRVTWGVYLKDRYVPVVDDTSADDMAAAEEMIRTFPGSMVLQSRMQGSVRIFRSVAANPAVLPHAARWANRFVRRSGGVTQNWLKARPVTFVMHQFIDAKRSKEAWAHIKAGTRATEPDIVEAQERLEACSYSMAHPDSDELVPACVQHGVLDPEENKSLVTLLPLRPKSATANPDSQIPG